MLAFFSSAAAEFLQVGFCYAGKFALVGEFGFFYKHLLFKEALEEQHLLVSNVRRNEEKATINPFEHLTEKNKSKYGMAYKIDGSRRDEI